MREKTYESKDKRLRNQIRANQRELEVICQVQKPEDKRKEGGGENVLAYLGKKDKKEPQKV